MNTLLVLFILVVAVMVFLFLLKIWRVVNQSLPADQIQKLDKVELFAQTLGTISAAVEDLKAQVGRDSALQSDLKKVLGEVDVAAKELARLRGERNSDLQQSQRLLDGLDQKVTGIVSTLTGRKSGAAGENILRELLKLFPSEWVRSPYHDVEFGLTLFGGRVIPVDSKFSGAELLEQIGRVEGATEREVLAEQIERRILSRAREVAKYIDPGATTSFAICAVPDSAYQLLRKTHLQSYQEYRVIIMPYSMTVPYLLAMYHLNLKQVGQIDEAQVEEFVSSIDQAVKALRDSLENKVRDAHTRLGNAHRDCVQAVGAIETAVATLKSTRLHSVPQPEKLEVIS